MEKIPDRTEDPVIQQIERWKAGPTIIASSSLFRLEQLEEMGFSDVTACSNIPEQVEIDRHLKMQAGAPKTHWDNDGQNMCEYIAEEKVRHVLNQSNVDPEVLVVAFDTTAVIYDEPTEEQIMGVPRSVEKFTSIEEARTTITKRFTQLYSGIVAQNARIETARQQQIAIGSSTEEIEMVCDMNRFSFRRGNLYVITGTAIAFPQTHDQIHRWSEEVVLFSTAIEKTAGNQEALEKLVDQIIETQGEEKTLSISGGVDYADSYVRDILELHEVYPIERDVADESLYYGFTPNTVSFLMQQQAQEITSTKNN